MAIVKMSNFSLFAFDSDRDSLLHELQKFGYVHFNDIDENESLLDEGLEVVDIPESISEVDEEISKAKYVIDILSKYYEKETGLKAMIKGLDNVNFNELEKKASDIDFLKIYTQVRELATKLDETNQEMKDLTSRKTELEHWKGLEYPLKDIRSIEKAVTFMGTYPKKIEENLESDLLELDYTYVENISEDKDVNYLFGLSSKEEEEKFNEILRNNGFSFITLDGEKTPREEIEDIDNQLQALETSTEEIIREIKELSSNLSNVQVVYEYLMNKKLRLMASENFLTTEKVNLINGYIPTEMKSNFEKAVKDSLKDYYYLDIEEADEEDASVPVLLKNSKFTESFESLTEMYALPRYNEVDPTPFLAPFYLAFFGMMVGDIGYGVIMLIGTLVALKVANLSSGQRNFIRFFHYLSYSTIVWGLVFGSFLGGIVPIKGLMDPATQYQELLIVSIVFGLIHLFFGLAINAYINIRDKKYVDAIFDVGFWYMAIAGGIVFLLTMFVALPPIAKTVSMIIMIAGMIGIVLTGGRDADGLAGKAAGGLYSLYGISSYVGDFVSYSRLMALGLAGGFIASSINMIVEMLSASGIIGIVFGVVVFIGGQLFNLFLSFLGAYVHTSRLTYVEFFSKFYEGGGKHFKLFRKEPKYINLK